jgi:hypothetical protein
VDTAAAIIHHGSMDDVLSTGQALALLARDGRPAVA